MQLIRRSMQALAITMWCAACGSESPIGAESAGELRTEPSAALCGTVAGAGVGKDTLLSELVTRGAIDGKNVALIKAKHVVVGMNGCETVAAWGLPERYLSNPAVDGRSERGLLMVYQYGLERRVDFGSDGLAIAVVNH